MQDLVTCLGRGSKGLITQRSQVQILPPLQEKHQVRGPFPTGRGPLALLPCVRECVPDVDVAASTLPLGRDDAGRAGTDHDAWDADLVGIG